MHVKTTKGTTINFRKVSAKSNYLRKLLVPVLFQIIGLRLDSLDLYIVKVSYLLFNSILRSIQFYDSQSKLRINYFGNFRMLFQRHCNQQATRYFSNKSLSIWHILLREQRCICMLIWIRRFYFGVVQTKLTIVIKKYINTLYVNYVCCNGRWVLTPSRTIPKLAIDAHRVL